MREVPRQFSTPVDESQPPFRGLRFLVIDDNADGRFLVSKTLLRKFPHSAVIECQSAESAFRILEQQSASLIISHRTHEYDGITLIRELRKRTVAPILMMSGIDRRDVAIPAGANAFLTYDEWLMVGNHVAALLTSGAERPNVEIQPTV